MKLNIAPENSPKKNTRVPFEAAFPSFQMLNILVSGRVVCLNHKTPRKLTTLKPQKYLPERKKGGDMYTPGIHFRVRVPFVFMAWKTFGVNDR